MSAYKTGGFPRSVNLEGYHIDGEIAGGGEAGRLQGPRRPSNPLILSLSKDPLKRGMVRQAHYERFNVYFAIVLGGEGRHVPPGVVCVSAGAVREPPQHLEFPHTS